MKKAIIAIIFLLIAMLATCPDKQSHQDKISEIINTSLKETISEKAGKGIANIGPALTSNIVEHAVDHMLYVDNYYIFSLGKVDWKGETKTVSLGILNQIITFRKEQVKEQMKEKLHLD